jgi:hypothetical protein
VNSFILERETSILPLESHKLTDVLSFAYWTILDQIKLHDALLLFWFGCKQHDTTLEATQQADYQAIQIYFCRTHKQVYVIFWYLKIPIRYE